LLAGSDVVVRRDRKHGDCTADSTDEEDSATAVAVDDEEAPNESESGLDDTEDTGGEQRGAGAGNAD